MERRIAVVDAFTDRAFSGNPAGVCVLTEYATDEWMQSLADEMRHSETAFLLPLAHPGCHSFAAWGWNADLITSMDVSHAFVLRWFTPGAEVNLCGHATLASAHYLFDNNQLDGKKPVTFYTRSGVLSVKPDGDNLVMDFPAVEVVPAPKPDWLRDVLPDAEIKLYGKASEDSFIELEDADAVRSAKPNLDALVDVNDRGMILTAAGDGEYDVVSRFFAPQVGVDEDPVTGSAHCAIGPFWSERLNKQEVRCYQASERGGVVYVRTIGDRVELVGRAVTILEGVLSATV
jgi:PhzF family phenazine biosynthesis protein